MASGADEVTKASGFWLRCDLNLDIPQRALSDIADALFAAERSKTSKRHHYAHPGAETEEHSASTPARTISSEFNHGWAGVGDAVLTCCLRKPAMVRRVVTKL